MHKLKICPAFISSKGPIVSGEYWCYRPARKGARCQCSTLHRIRLGSSRSGRSTTPAWRHPAWRRGGAMPPCTVVLLYCRSIAVAFVLPVDETRGSLAVGAGFPSPLLRHPLRQLQGDPPKFMLLSPASTPGRACAPGPAAPPPRPSPSSPSPPRSCDTFVVLLPATADGSVVFGKNSDREREVGGLGAAVPCLA